MGRKLLRYDDGILQNGMKQLFRAIISKSKGSFNNADMATKFFLGILWMILKKVVGPDFWFYSSKELKCCRCVPSLQILAIFGSFLLKISVFCYISKPKGSCKNQKNVTKIFFGTLWLYFKKIVGPDFWIRSLKKFYRSQHISSISQNCCFWWILSHLSKNVWEIERFINNLGCCLSWCSKSMKSVSIIEKQLKCSYLE